jgi:hypothetical protein
VFKSNNETLQRKAYSRSMDSVHALRTGSRQFEILDVGDGNVNQSFLDCASQHGAA